VSSRDFYALVRRDRAFAEEYQALRRLRGHMLLDQCDDILSSDAEAKLVRARIDCIIKMIGQLHPDRYGDRVKVQVEEKPSILPALEAARARAGLPIRDLARDGDGTYRTIPGVEDQRTPDRQSDERPKRPRLAPAYEPPDPFE